MGSGSRAQRQLEFGEVEQKGGEVEVDSKWNAFRAAAGADRFWDRRLEAQLNAGRQSTRRRLLVARLIAAALMVAAGGLSFGGDALAQRLIQVGAASRTATVTVYIGKSEDVRTDSSFVDITVGDPEVADVNPLTDRSLSILGKKNGTTRVSVYAEGKKLIGVFDVEVVYDTSLLQAEIKRRFPHANLKVSAVNGRIMISGTAPDGPTVDKAVQIAKQFGPEVINSVQVSQPQQVMLEVRFVEATREAGRELGVQWNVFGNNYLANIGNRTPAAQLPVTNTGGGLFSQPGVTVGGPNVPSGVKISPIEVAGVLSGTAPFGVMVGKMIKGGLDIDVIINALEQKGVARSLAEPNLVALSGDTASFLAGGEYPIPVPGGPQGQVTIDYKRFGVGLAFTPTVLSDGLINMKIEPEVSQLDFSRSLVLQGASVPSLIVRRASTTVELRDGQSFVIGGLLQSVGANTLSQLPWLGDVPILGALFRSAQYQKSETDLAIIVTPRLVRPARPGDVVKTPLDSSLPVNDTDLFLMGKTEITPAMAQLIAGVPPRENTGHMLDLTKGGTHVVSARN
jgi:pilus assembly protein CpaC